MIKFAVFCTFAAKNWYIMLGKLQENQRELFRTRLEDLINPNYELALLAKRVDWQYFADAFNL